MYMYTETGDSTCQLKHLCCIENTWVRGVSVSMYLSMDM